MSEHDIGALITRASNAAFDVLREHDAGSFGGLWSRYAITEFMMYLNECCDADIDIGHCGDPGFVDEFVMRVNAALAEGLVPYRLVGLAPEAQP